MLPRERICNAVGFRPVDRLPIRIASFHRGLYEHGEKLRELLMELGSDVLADLAQPIPVPRPETMDAYGNYNEYMTDQWGVTWQHRIFCIQGHPVKRPLDDMSLLDSYRLPPHQALPADWLERLRENRDYFYIMSGWVTVFEKLCELRLFDDVLADLAARDEDILTLTDRICDYHAVELEKLAAADVDCIEFGDDWGMQYAMMISPEMFREIFKPRIAKLMAIVKSAGKQVMVHCCGQAMPIIEDFKEMGGDMLWPQLNCYDLNELAAVCRDLRLAVAIHPERSHLMTHATPQEVSREIHRYVETFRCMEGGSFIHLEIDNGFPYENIVAMVEALKEYR